MGVDMDRFLRVLQPAFLPCELRMFASCHRVETQPLVVEERYIRLVAGSSAITLKLSSRIRCTLVFKGWYVSTKGILLIFSFVELLLERASL